VGTTQLGSTAAIFMNGMLQHEYGVTIEDIHWFIDKLIAPTQRAVDFVEAAGEKSKPCFCSRTDFDTKILIVCVEITREEVSRNPGH
jgi:hypothetical protein